MRCAPPANKPLPAERDTCADWLRAELAELERRARRRLPRRVRAGRPRFRQLAPALRPRPRFGHGAEARAGALTLLGCFPTLEHNKHPRRRLPRGVRVGRRSGSSRRSCARAPASATARRRARRPDPARLLPPEPAEHVHRQADARHARRRARARPRAGGSGAQRAERERGVAAPLGGAATSSASSTRATPSQSTRRSAGVASGRIAPCAFARSISASTARPHARARRREQLGRDARLERARQRAVAALAHRGVGHQVLQRRPRVGLVELARGRARSNSARWSATTAATRCSFVGNER